VVDIVVKVGGGLLAHAGDFDTVLTTIAAAAQERRVLIVPGGGPFADTVRQVDRHLKLTDDAAHWMAVIAMDQCGHLIADRLARSVLVADQGAIAIALNGGQLPVLEASRWIREADPLPHTWDVTSDSIAAWVAGQTGARRLVLVKPRGTRERAGAAGALVDAYFPRAIPPGVDVTIVAADQTAALHRAVRDIA
jgi:5-(aminomethyl)-3-furanmethanol phosphate kinase